MKIIDCVQGSPEWFAARAGKVTASNIAKVMSQGRSKNSESVTRTNYLWQIVAERMTGKPQESRFETEEMKWGKEQELFARAAYEMANDVLVRSVGLVIHPRFENGAASPDGLIGDLGCQEIKCPNSDTHLGWIYDGIVPEKHKYQMDWQMACTEKDFCEFISFDPRVPEEVRLFQITYPRDQQRIDAIEAEVERFLSEVYERIEKLRRVA
jgi:putative phage-type endonuclease